MASPRRVIAAASSAAARPPRGAAGPGPAPGAGGRAAGGRAAGLDSRCPGEKVGGLEEALRIIRGLWTDETFSFEGEHFTVRDARLTPRPERHIPIWLGVYGDRMLGVLGRLADGWLPSSFVVGFEKVLERRDVLRKAAEEAGRDPDEITCGFNVWVMVREGAEPKEGQIAGSPDRVVEDLSRLVEQGFTHLNLSPSGDPWEQFQRLAGEVIPALQGS
jgi:alkanesulfonate monooxygenase SsuD/methylene tetrahydromethanopterin reductase-like flavin-dependent oxidoreductase (luciferase family)